MRIFGIIPRGANFGDFEAFEESRWKGSVLEPHLVQLALLLLKNLGRFQTELAEVATGDLVGSVRSKVDLKWPDNKLTNCNLAPIATEAS